MFPSVNSPLPLRPYKCFPPCSQDSFSLILPLLSFVISPTNNLLARVSSLAFGQRNAPKAEKCAKCREMRRMQSNWSALSLTLLLPSFFTFSAPTYHSSFLRSLFFISFPTGTCAAGNGSKFFRELSSKNLVFQNPGRKYIGTQMIIIFFKLSLALSV